MKGSSVLVVKFSPEAAKFENELDRVMYIEMGKRFTDKEQEDRMILDEENMTLVAFLHGDEKHKLDEVVEAARAVSPGVVEKYEDVTEKFVHQNDFTDYNVKSEMIFNFIKSNLNIDDVFSKLRNLGEDNLIDVDREIIQEWAA